MAEQGRVIQPSFAGGELAPSLYGRVDLGKYQVGLRRARNVFIRAHGGVANRAGFAFVGETEAFNIQPRIITFQFNPDQSYALEFGHQVMRVIRNGGFVVETGKTISGATQADPVVITATAHGFSSGDQVFIQGVGGMAELNGRTFRVSNATTNTFELDSIGVVDIDGTGYGAYTGGGTAAQLFTLATPYSEGDLFDLRFVQSADVMYLVHPSHAPRKLSRLADDNWTLTTVTFAPAIGAPQNVQVVRDVGGVGSTTYRYHVTAIAAETGEESLPSGVASVDADLSTAGNRNRVFWSAVSGAEKYVVYKDDLNVLGFIGETTNTEFFDENIEQDRSDTAPQARNPFEGADNYPSAVTFYEQRLAFANTNNNPQTVWLSNSANFENFNVSSPAKDDDAVTVSIYARELNAIRHLVPLDDLIAFTSSVEWRIAGASDPGFITPSSVERRPQTYWGAATVPPLVIGNTILFVQDKGSKVRDFGYTFESDGYQGNDLSILANHLFEGRTVRDWTYAKVPHSVVWAVRDDGALLSFTYLREHQVWAWALHTTDGTFESVTAVSEGMEDVLYAVVRRTLEGRTARTVERMRSRFFTDIEDAFFVDSGLTYDGAATRTLGGLWHLEGLTVVALANGNVVRDLTVTGGAVTFDFDVTTAHVGLPYVSDVQTLPVDLGSREGTVQGRKKRLSRVVLRVEKTRGLFVGPDETLLTEHKQRDTEAWGDPIQPVTGDIEIPIRPQWDTEGDLWIRQSDPLPMTLLAAMPEVTVGT